MDWRNVDTTHCGVAASSEIVGDRWTLLILRDLFAGVTRFDDLHRHVGVSTAVLADRLKRLCDRGVLERVPYSEEGQRRRFEYHLTDRGVSLLYLQIALAEFGYEHLVDPEHKLIDLVDGETGQPVRLGLLRQDGSPADPSKVAIKVRAPSASAS